MFPVFIVNWIAEFSGHFCVVTGKGSGGGWSGNPRKQALDAPLTPRDGDGRVKWGATRSSTLKSVGIVSMGASRGVRPQKRRWLLSSTATRSWPAPAKDAIVHKVKSSTGRLISPSSSGDSEARRKTAVKVVEAGASSISPASTRPVKHNLSRSSSRSRSPITPARPLQSEECKSYVASKFFTTEQVILETQKKGKNLGPRWQIFPAAVLVHQPSGMVLWPS